METPNGQWIEEVAGAKGSKTSDCEGALVGPVDRGGRTRWKVLWEEVRGQSSTCSVSHPQCHHFGPSNSLLWGPVHCRIFSSLPGIYPLDAGSTRPPSYGNQKVSSHCQMTPEGQITPAWEPLLGAGSISLPLGVWTQAVLTAGGQSVKDRRKALHQYLLLRKKTNQKNK